MPNDNLTVKVRMYRHGLGDCFLLIFERGGETFNLLIDCGIFYQTPNGKNIMTAVAEDIRDVSGKRLDAVALTHDHYDHISGFKLADEIFDEADFKFKEIWVGWTEDEGHPKYEAVRDHFRNILKGLRVALDGELTAADAGLRSTVGSLVNEFFGYEKGVADDVFGVTGFSKTWDHLLTEKAEDVKCFTPGTVFELEGFGVRVYVLGPPEDFDVIEMEEPTQDESYRHSLRMGLAGSFLSAATAADNSTFDANAYMPFDDGYNIAKEQAETIPFFRDNYGFDDRNSWRRIDEDWLRTAADLALWMDDFTNNTCLALAIELVESGKVMIFPGDAQFGNWMSWQNYTWEVTDGNGGTRPVKAADLLARTVFYKVGHHGSHNATLRKSGLEMMNIPDRGLVAMIPTNQEFARGRPHGGWKMPEEKLLERLEQKSKGRVILADEAGEAGDTKLPLEERCTRLGLSAAKRNAFLNSVEFGGSLTRFADSQAEEPLWVQYTVEG